MLGFDTLTTKVIRLLWELCRDEVGMGVCMGIKELEMTFLGIFDAFL